VITVYHVAAMGDTWKPIFHEQLEVLQSSGIKDVRLSHVGTGLEYIVARFQDAGIRCEVVFSDANVHHCETQAMVYIDRLCKEENCQEPILYMHTKGASNPTDAGKSDWRRLMNDYVVRRWRVNLGYLWNHDAVGVNWQEGGEQHFSGNFWIANPDWIRKLPRFVDYHWARGGNRYSCEMWIGAKQWCRAKTLGCKNECFWSGHHPINVHRKWLPAAIRSTPPSSYFLSFSDAFQYFGTDKDSLHSYGPIYEALFPLEKRLEVKNVLEIGIKEGMSLNAWHYLFPQATIHGIDINGDLCASVPETRCKVIFGDATNPQEVEPMLRTFGDEHLKFDLIVDDASHRLGDQLATIALFKSRMATDGIFIVEDVFTSHPKKPFFDAFGDVSIMIDRRGLKKRFDDIVIVGANRFSRDIPSIDALEIPFTGDQSELWL
jgi:hypothetical protein